tara:strand:- start:207 stop:1109 length:903 start_codon:yes stop_codon:yes gene_type:complete
MAIKWIHEEVLQRYIKENPHKWKINGKKVLAVEYNVPFNAYPDLFFTVEGESNRIPVEVEWTSVDFKHPIEVLKDNKGWVFVCYKNKEDSEIGAPQFEIPRKDFVRWVKSNGDKLANDTISNIVSDEYKRKTPKLWIQYIGNRGGAIPHYDIALKQQCWGIPQSASALKKFKEIKKNDLIMFVIQGVDFAGRVPKQIWEKKSFKGKFKKIQVFRITRGYYQSNKIVWKKSTSDEIWPHRFDFEARKDNKIVPFVNMKNLKVNKMAAHEKEQLRVVVSANFIEGDHSTLVDCMHSSEQSNN